MPGGARHRLPEDFLKSTPEPGEMVDRDLIGRDDELALLGDRLRRAIAGEGALVLVAGEGGVGKTRLMDALGSSTPAIVLRGAATRDATPAYGPVVAALRSYLRANPGGLDDCGPLGEHLRVLLPELGPSPDVVDTATLHEAVRCALATAARDRGALVLLDDLQWSDAATLELLSDLDALLSDAPLLVVGAYRSDELPREHPLRRTHTELRRRHALDEVSLAPLDETSTAALLERELGGKPSRPLVRTVHDRAQGLPFFVEELASALSKEARLQKGAAGLELAEGSEVTVPETVRDAVLLRSGDLSAEGRAAAEAAAIAGERFELESLVELTSEDGIGELLEAGLIAECGEGRAAFRHALVREALYRDVPWLRRRALHRELGERLEARSAPGVEIAPHWLGAHDEERARSQLLRAATEFESVHAYRDAAGMVRQALELWPEGEHVDERLEALERHGAWAELAGELRDAARTWREVSSLHRVAGDGPALAAAERRLGRVCALQGDRAGAIEALSSAAEAFAASGDLASAAGDRLAASDFLQFAGRHSASLALSRLAGEEARTAKRIDLQSRALTAQGVVMAKRGEFESGMELVKQGLSLALEHNLTAEAVDAYQRLGTTFETAGDYANARVALSSALDLCRITDNHEPEAGCVACMAYVLVSSASGRERSSSLAS